MQARSCACIFRVRKSPAWLNVAFAACHTGSCTLAISDITETNSPSMVCRNRSQSGSPTSPGLSPLPDHQFCPVGVDHRRNINLNKRRLCKTRFALKRASLALIAAAEMLICSCLRARCPLHSNLCHSAFPQPY